MMLGTATGRRPTRKFTAMFEMYAPGALGNR